MIFFRNVVIQQAESLNEPGGILWKLALCLLASWATVCLCMMLDIKSYGKVRAYACCDFCYYDESGIKITTLFYLGNFVIMDVLRMDEKNVQTTTDNKVS